MNSWTPWVVAGLLLTGPVCFLIWTLIVILVSMCPLTDKERAEQDASLRRWEDKQDRVRRMHENSIRADERIRIRERHLSLGYEAK